MTDSTHIVCTDCLAVNRIPTERLNEGPRCGKCRTPLFRGRASEFTDGNFNTHVKRSEIPVIVDFWAPWCGPCKMMAPAFEKAAAELEPGVRLAKLNTEDQAATATQYRVQSIPTLIAFNNGREVGRQSGAMGAADIVRWVKALGF